jgi:hypothetical protein
VRTVTCLIRQVVFPVRIDSYHVRPVSFLMRKDAFPIRAVIIPMRTVSIPIGIVTFPMRTDSILVRIDSILIRKKLRNVKISVGTYVISVILMVFESGLVNLRFFRHFQAVF